MNIAMKNAKQKKVRCRQTTGLSDEYNPNLFAARCCLRFLPCFLRQDFPQRF